MEHKITYRRQNPMSRFLHFILFTRDLQKRQMKFVFNNYKLFIIAAKSIEEYKQESAFPLSQ